MMSLFNINTVARFETKTLLRSWFFRIFAILILGFVLLFNIFGVAAIGDGGWPGRLLPSGGIYFNLWLLNIAQAIIAVFLSADFLGRDKKLDTTESFYVRSISNTEYVIGKTLGVLKVFIILNLIVLAISLLTSLISSEIAVNWTSYLYYPLLISFPTLVFILGLSFFTMTLIRNQAITFVLLLGFIALSMFYLKQKWYGITDFLGFYTSFMRSDFTGFGNEIELISTRSFYLIAGLIFIIATIWRLPRLKQNRFQNIKLGSAIVTLSIVGFLLLSIKVKNDTHNEKLRAEVQSLNSTLKPSAFKITSYTIELDHIGAKINTKATMEIEKVSTGSTPLVFALNPGLKVETISINNQTVDFSRKTHLLLIKSEVQTNETLQVTISYQGTIEDAAMFPDVTEELWTSSHRTDPLLASKQHSFITDRFVMLTREANWYPVIAKKQYWTSYPFTQMDLTVKTKPGLHIISQGKKENIAVGSCSFLPEQNLNAYSLVIGEFEHNSTNVDGTQFNLYHHKNHTYFKPYFSEVNDTIADVLKTMKDDFERKLGVDYPFDQFSLVEAPINFYSYMRNWNLSTENNMPGMVFFPENGGGTWSNDLGNTKERVLERYERSNDEVSEREKQVEILKTYLGNNFIKPSHFFFGRRRTSGRDIENWGKYQVFPQYFTYSNAIAENDYPLITIAIENYLHQQLSDNNRFGSRGLSSNDKVILKLRESSMNELIAKEDINTLGNVFASKGNELISNLKVNDVQGNFDEQFTNWIEDNRFTSIPLEGFSTDISRIGNTDFDAIYQNWLKQSKQPAFMFGSVDVYEIKEGNRIRYFTKLPVSNSGEANGIVSFTIREGRRGGRGGRFRSWFQMDDQSDNEQIFNIPAGTTQEIGFLLDEEPRRISVNTYLSINIPSSQNLAINNVDRETRQVDYFEGIRPSSAILQYKSDDEIIVDNEDEGFSVVNTGESRTIKDWWISIQDQEDDSNDYGSINFWSHPVKWKPIINDQYFGKYLKSAYYKRNGSGEGVATWKANIEQSGTYDVYAYVPHVRGGRWRGRHSGGSAATNYNFTVFHDDGQDEVVQKIDNDNNEWVYLGQYYLSEGSAKVELSDMTNGEWIIADAIKWIKK